MRIEFLGEDPLNQVTNYLDNNSLLQCRLVNKFFKARADKRFYKIEQGAEFLAIGRRLLLKQEKTNLAFDFIELMVNDYFNFDRYVINKFSQNDLLNSFFSCEGVAIYKELNKAQAYVSKVKSNLLHNADELKFCLIKKATGSLIPTFKYLSYDEIPAPFEHGKIYGHAIFFVKVKNEVIMPLSVANRDSFVMNPALFEVLGYIDPVIDKQVMLNSSPCLIM